MGTNNRIVNVCRDVEDGGGWSLKRGRRDGGEKSPWRRPWKGGDLARYHVTNKRVIQENTYCDWQKTSSAKQRHAALTG